MCRVATRHSLPGNACILHALHGAANRQRRDLTSGTSPMIRSSALASQVLPHCMLAALVSVSKSTAQAREDATTKQWRQPRCCARNVLASQALPHGMLAPLRHTFCLVNPAPALSLDRGADCLRDARDKMWVKSPCTIKPRSNRVDFARRDRDGFNERKLFDALRLSERAMCP